MEEQSTLARKLGEISIKVMISVLLIMHERRETLLSRVNQLNPSPTEERRSQIILWRERKAHAGSVVTDSLRVVGCGRLLSK